mgnify:CR=1 FL=1
MPDISGFEVAQQMKADPEMAEIPIIFLTALNSTADIVKGFQVGGNDFISKPFNKEELIIRCDAPDFVGCSEKNHCCTNGRVA